MEGVGATERGRGPIGIVSALIAGNLVLTLFLAYALPIWIDEAFTLQDTGKDLAYALQQARYFETQPPLYWILLTLWRGLDDGIFFARLFSVLCVTLTLFVAADISKRWLPSLHPAWLVGIMAVNPYMIFAATEIRVYAFLMLVYSILWLSFYDGFWAENPSRRAQIFYALVALAGIHTQFFVGFFLVAGAVALLVAGRYSQARVYILFMAVVGVFYIPMLLAVPDMVGQTTRTIVDKPSIFGSGLFVVSRTVAYVMSLLAYPPLARRAAQALFVGVLAAALFFGRANVTRRLAGTWALAGTIAVFHAAVVMFITGKDYMLPRHSSGLIFPGLVVVFSIFELLNAPWRRRVVAGTACAIVLSSVLTLTLEYRTLAKPGDSRRVADHIEAHENPDEPILIFTPVWAESLKYYYDGINVFVPLPREQSYEKIHATDYVMEDEREIVAALDRAGVEADAVWVLTAPSTVGLNWAGTDLHVEVLQGWLERNYSLRSETYFKGALLRFFEREGDTRTN